MTAATLKQRLAAGETVIGTFAGLGSALAVEALGVAGLDWVVIDLEHGGGHEAALAGQLQAAAVGGLHAIVRVEAPERARVGRALDSGAEGIMFPRIDGAEQAQAAVRQMRYPPDGDRGVAAYNRAYRFGTRGHDIDSAAARITGVVQIETLGAVDEVEEIAALDGVDALFIGPADLSHAMGIRGRLDDPRFRAALTRVVAAADAAGKAAGILVNRPDLVPAALADGFRLVAVGSDSTLLVQGAAAAVAAHPAR